MEGGSSLEQGLTSIEERVRNALLLIERGFLMIRSHPEIRGRQYFLDIFESVNIEDVAIEHLILQCFQLNTGRCKFCERFSSIGVSIVGTLYMMATLFLQFNAEFLDHFPHLGARICRQGELKDLQQKGNAAYKRQLQIEIPPRDERCVCVQLPREGLNRMYSKALDFTSLYLRSLSRYLLDVNHFVVTIFWR